MRPNTPSKNASRRILVVDDDQAVRTCVAQILTHSGFTVSVAPDADVALTLLASEPVDLLLVDLKLPGLDGIQLIREASQRRLALRSMVISGHGTIERAVEAVKAGAEQFITKPFQPDELMAVVHQILTDPHADDSSMKTDWSSMVGHSASMQELYREVEKIATSERNVLLLGESGTGKDLLARALHERSPRAERPFFAINCSVLSEDLLARELFGQEHPSSSAGDVRAKHGLFEVAAGGTLFLDEIAHLSLAMQSRLLNALEDRGRRPAGSDREIPVDVRLIAATNQDLAALVQTGAFRQDLYYRLSTISLMLPPLRERREDIPSLVAHFLQEFAVTHFKKIDRCSPEAMERFLVYDYPGNVRELRSAIERAVLLADGPEILPRHLPASIRETAGPEVCRLYPTLDEQERRYIEKVLLMTRGHRGDAARILGIDRRTLYDKIKRYGLSPAREVKRPRVVNASSEEPRARRIARVRAR